MANLVYESFSACIVFPTLVSLLWLTAWLHFFSQNWATSTVRSSSSSIVSQYFSNLLRFQAEDNLAAALYGEKKQNTKPNKRPVCDIFVCVPLTHTSRRRTVNGRRGSVGVTSLRQWCPEWLQRWLHDGPSVQLLAGPE